MYSRNYRIVLTKQLEDQGDGFRHVWVTYEAAGDFGAENTLPNFDACSITMDEGIEGMVVRFKVLLTKPIYAQYLRYGLFMQKQRMLEYPKEANGMQVDYREIPVLIPEKQTIRLCVSLSSDADTVVTCKVVAYGVLEVDAYEKRKCQPVS